MRRSCFLAVVGLLVVATAAVGDEPMICGKGWGFDRAELRWPDWIPLRGTRPAASVPGFEAIRSQLRGRQSNSM